MFIGGFSCLDALTIGVVGDSTVIDRQNRTSYASYVEEYLMSEGHECTFVKDAQLWSSLEDGPKKVEKMIKENNLDCIIITLGVSDIIRHTPAYMVYRHFLAMIYEAKRHSIPVFIGFIETSFFSKITENNGKYLCEFENVFTLLESEEVQFFNFLYEDIILWYTNDFVHPDDRGAEIIAFNILREMRKVIPELKVKNEDLLDGYEPDTTPIPFF